jgi:predicted porin
MIRKTAVGVILGIGASLAQADSVQVYGILDIAAEALDHVGPSGGKLIREPSLSGGQLPTRLGFRGDEDMGGGWQTRFVLEAGIAPDTGGSLQSGRLFGRQAFLGIGQKDLGMVSAGRQWTMTFYSMLDADVIGPASFGSAGLDSYLPQARVDNSVAYRGNFGGLSVGGTYSIGRDTLAPGNCPGEAAGKGVTCAEWSTMLKYDSPAWGAAVAYDRQNGGPAGTFIGQPAGTIPSGANADKRLIVDGYVNVGGAKIGGGWIKRNLVAAPTGLSTDLFFLGTSYPVGGAFSIDAQALYLHDTHAASNARMVVARANYALSKRTYLYLMAGHVSNDSKAAYSLSAGGLQSSLPPVGEGQSGVLAGMRHSF